MHVTPAERRVLLAAANGLTQAETARLHRITEHTVKHHRRNVMRRAGANNFTHAVALAWRACLIDADDVTGGPVNGRGRRMTRDDVVESLLALRDRERLLPPPDESWPELRARAAALAADVRARRPPR